MECGDTPTKSRTMRCSGAGLAWLHEWRVYRPGPLIAAVICLTPRESPVFASLFGKSNPTRQWQPHGRQPLTFDLDAGSLNDGKLGQRLGCVSFLGPDEDRKAFRNGEFRYYSLGLCVECCGSDDDISAYHIVFLDPDDDKYRAFRGRVVRNGGTVDLSAITPATCSEILGDYFWIDRDEDESIVFYEFAGREWQLEFNDSSSLKRLIVTNRPLLANEAQRRAYNVTKPWPASD